MNDINHHLTDALLMGYSAGTLPEAFSLVVASHISLCDECRARLESFDAVGGAVLERSGRVAMDDGALEACLGRIANADWAPTRTVAKAVGSDLPEPLTSYVGGGLGEVRWRKIGGGVSQAVLKTSKGATARLLHIPAGRQLPDHGHQGTELTLVLKGAFRDEEERFGAGDIEVADQHLTHKPVAEEGEDCICLAATDAPLRFSTMLPRLVQPFFKI
ncbi:ChrR family anti-sigma-E factor [Aestuariibius insulae]|uniref:ChrR family anti-sigma-E factor n=1 Tax=Aestuariibius insulae TaxID=2058287 RepID=UPI00345E9C1F